MARKQKKYHYIYKTTNILSGRYYIGMHSTDNLEDGYIGSGKRLWFSINYHGKENHIKEILEFLPDRNSLKEREREIVNEELLGDKLCMNLQLGGEGGFSSNKHMVKCSKAGIKKFKERFENDIELQKKYSENGKKAMKKLRDSGKASAPPDWTGRKHSEETKNKLRKPKNHGSENPSYGTCWITKNGENKKINKEGLNDWLNNGWFKGRKNK